MKRSAAMGQLAAGGRTIGRYRVVKHLASGGMAEIYLATYDDRGTEREAVVKVILRERARDRKFVQMFLDEARVSSTFTHPNIAQLFEVGRDGDTYFYAMEYVAGDNVRALIERSLRARQRMPLATTLAIGTRVADALHYAHEKTSATGQRLNAVHRDVTPSNIMLGFDGAVKLLDFGIARADTRAQMTQSGTVKGKFAYMSPEQCKGHAVDRRTDVFALGIVLYELSTQRRAFRAETDFETMERIMRGDVLPPRRIHADYPRELEAILLRALATDVDERYQSAAELGEALVGFQRAQGLPLDESPVAGMMRSLFGVEPPPAAAPPVAHAPLPAAGVSLLSPRPAAPPPPSLASMLAATVDPAIATPAAAAPMPAPAPPPVMMAVPPPVRGQRPSTIPVRGPAPPSATPMSLDTADARDGFDAGSLAHGTPPGFPLVTPEDDAAAAFARHSGSLPVITMESSTMDAPAVMPASSGAHAVPPVPASSGSHPVPSVSELPPTGTSPVGYASPFVSYPAPWGAPAPALEPAPPAPTFAPPADDATAAEGHRLGLWVAVAAILAVGGVVAAILVLSSLGVF